MQNRKQRRALEATKGKKPELQEILARLAAVDFQEIAEASKVINEVHALAGRASQLADALVEDHETLLVEMDVNRELLKEILGPVFKDSIADARDRVLLARAAAKAAANQTTEGQ